MFYYELQPAYVHLQKVADDLICHILIYEGAYFSYLYYSSMILLNQIDSCRMIYHLNPNVRGSNWSFWAFDPSKSRLSLFSIFFFLYFLCFE